MLLEGVLLYSTQTDFNEWRTSQTKLPVSKFNLLQFYDLEML